jgi:predicted RNA binding protein YcfA (HicA-like mRNA interferase family)
MLNCVHVQTIYQVPEIMNIKTIEAFLSEHGFAFKRQASGSHSMWFNAATRQTVVMANSLVRQGRGKGLQNFLSEVRRKSISC